MRWFSGFGLGRFASRAIRVGGCVGVAVVAGEGGDKRVQAPDGRRIDLDDLRKQEPADTTGARGRGERAGVGEVTADGGPCATVRGADPYTGC